MSYYLGRLSVGVLCAVVAAGGAACGKGKGDGGGGGAGGAGGAPAGAAASGGGGGGKKGGSAGGGSPRKPLEFPVEVEVVAAQRVEYAVRAVGSVEAFEQVQVTARVAGAVEKLDFAEGDRVKAGQVLVEIEPRRFQIAVEAARASLARAKAETAETQAALDRRIEANAKSAGLVKAEEIESMRTRVAAQTAAEQAAQSQLHLAELNLRDAFVRAPIAGLIETREVRTGQYVQPGTPVATLLRREPLLLRFQVPELDVANIARDREAHFTVRPEEPAMRAVITHVAQAADEATRMVAVTARVDDPRSAELRPGAFAQVTVPIETRDDAPVIVQSAVRPSERGFVAFVIEEGVAKERRLELGLRTLDGRVEVKSGLKIGDQLVIRGTEALSDGAKVKVSGASAPPPAPAPAAPAAEASPARAATGGT